MPPTSNQLNSGEVFQAPIQSPEVTPEFQAGVEVPKPAEAIAPAIPSQTPETQIPANEREITPQAETPVITPDSTRVEVQAADRVVEGVMPKYEALGKRVNMDPSLDAATIGEEYSGMATYDAKELGIEEAA